MKSVHRKLQGRRCALLKVAIALTGIIPAIASAAYRAEGHCRDGEPHGAYVLRSSTGAPVAIGAFNHGKRTGSFIFWNEAGVRIAHVPYDDDVISGTVALWYPAPVKDGATPQKRETPYANGKRNGVARSWRADGKLGVESEYRDGVLASARALDGRGRPLPEAAALATARAEEADDVGYYRTLEKLIADHPPPCHRALKAGNEH